MLPAFWMHSKSGPKLLFDSILCGNLDDPLARIWVLNPDLTVAWSEKSSILVKYDFDSFEFSPDLSLISYRISNSKEIIVREADGTELGKISYGDIPGGKVVELGNNGELTILDTVRKRLYTWRHDKGLRALVDVPGNVVDLDSSREGYIRFYYSVYHGEDHPTRPAVLINIRTHQAWRGIESADKIPINLKWYPQ